MAKEIINRLLSGLGLGKFARGSINCKPIKPKEIVQKKECINKPVENSSFTQLKACLHGFLFKKCEPPNKLECKPKQPADGCKTTSEILAQVKDDLSSKKRVACKEAKKKSSSDPCLKKPEKKKAEECPPCPPPKKVEKKDECVIKPEKKDDCVKKPEKKDDCPPTKPSEKCDPCLKKLDKKDDCPPTKPPEKCVPCPDKPAKKSTMFNIFSKKSDICELEGKAAEKCEPCPQQDIFTEPCPPKGPYNPEARCMKCPPRPRPPQPTHCKEKIPCMTNCCGPCPRRTPPKCKEKCCD